MFKKILAVFLCIFLFGCAGADTSEPTFSFSDTEEITLWVVTEQTTKDGMNRQAELLAERFCEAHPNVTVEIDILPVEEEARSDYLQWLREEITAGGGPDVYLLPSDDLLILDEPRQYTYTRVEPLFPSVEIAMRSGVFADVDSFYAGDRELGTDGLSQQVMDAGVVGQKRYVLPLRFDMSVVFVIEEELEAMGYTAQALEDSFLSWIEYVIAQEDPILACGAEFASLNLFDSVMDFDTNTVTLPRDTLEQYIRFYPQITTLVGSEMDHRSQLTLENYGFVKQDPFPVHIDNLQNCVVHAAIALAEGQTLSMYPVRTTSGESVAVITYYGAVGSGCSHPEAAYAFLREFLSEDAQFEQLRGTPETEQYTGLTEQSWPVRVEGSVPPLWQQLQNQVMPLKGARGSMYQLSTVELTQEQIPILSDPIGIVRFPVNSSAIRYITNPAATESPAAAADAVIRQLEQDLLS